MAIDAETERKMSNWARWLQGGGGGCALSAIYKLEAPGPRAETSMPLIDGEAVDVNGAVEALPQALRVVVVGYWAKTGTVNQKAHDCRIPTGTFYRRLERGHAQIKRHLDARRRAAEEVGRLYRAARAAA